MRWFTKNKVCLLLLFTAAMVMTGCGNKKQAPSNASQENKAEEKQEPEEISGTVVVYTNRLDMVQTKFAEYKAIFEKENPGTEIIFKAYSDYERDVPKEIGEGNFGDVVLIPKNFDSEKLSRYFEPLGTVEELSEIYDEPYLHAAEQDGIVYGITQYVMPQGIAYNKKVFEKAGVIELPRTTEEFLSVLKKIKASDSDVLPIYIGEERTQSQEWWRLQLSEQLQNHSIDSVFNLLYEMKHQGLSEEHSLGWKQVREQLNNGEIGCVPTEWSELSAIKKAAPNPDDIGYMPFPGDDGIQYAGAALEYCYAINKNSKNKDTARAWMDYMLNSSDYANSEGAVSIYKKDSLPVFLSDFKDTMLIVCETESDNGDGTPPLPEPEFNERWSKALQEQASSD